LRRPLAAAALLVGLAACSAGGEYDRTRSDWETANSARIAKESDPLEAPLPGPLNRASLAEFFVSSASDFRFFVDTSAIAVTPDGLVRYVLVARSPAGAENVTYEVLSCRGQEYRVYGSARADGSWARLNTPWRPLGPRAPAQRILTREYFCPSRIAIASPQEGAEALRRGGHALAAPPHPVSGGGK